MTKNDIVTPERSWAQVILFGRNPRVTLVRAAITVIVLLLLSQFVFLPIKVEGISMLPTYKSGRINFVNRLTYRMREPQRGDIVAIRFSGPHVMLMKRIVGMPGETVSFSQGQLLINGQPLPEPYLKLPCRWDHGEEKVGPNEYYVVGDNRSMGFYDHTQGVADRKRIIGKVLL
jgi:signal peptidase I